MYKYLSIIIFVCVFFAVNVRAEYIDTLDVDIVINDDATLDVTEYIVYDFDTEEKHGMYRDIPIKYKTDTGNTRSIDLSAINVVDENNVPRTFVVSQEGSDKRIKIGDADVYVTGEQTYLVSYTIDGAMNYFDTHDELYWNAIGGNWNVPIHAAHVTVHASQIDRVTCFSGSYGSTILCDEIIEYAGGVVEFMQKDIVPGAGMTVAIDMPVGTVYKPTFTEKILAFLADNWISILPIFTLIGMWRVWAKKGRDPKGRGTIVPYYEPPDDLSPAEVGLIAHEKVTKDDVSALIINLAVHGYMKIRQVEKKDALSLNLRAKSDYLFVKTDKSIESHTAIDEKLFYKSLFKHAVDGNIVVSQLTNTFYKDLEVIKNCVREQVVAKGYYDKNPQTVVGLWLFVGFTLFMAAIIFGNMFGLATGIALTLSGIIVGGFSFVMPQRTSKGALVRDHILGLTLYMQTAEKDRINFHNAPAKNPAQFEKLLPYAMVLGVEKQWAQQFEDIYDQSPEWYEGTGALHAGALVSDLSAFSSTTSSAMVAQPSSSMSGGSGFSGGGSGGGGGGGGGGSW